MNGMAERKNPKVADRAWFDEIPEPWRQQVTSLFDGIQAEIDAGQPLDTEAWFAEISKSAERWWDVYARRMEHGRRG